MLRKSNEVKKKEQLKIAMIGHKRIPSREGGVEIVVEELSKRMVLQGHEVTCYNRRGHHVSGKEFDEKSQSIYEGIKIKTVPTYDKKGLAAITSSIVAAFCAAFGKYDVVHFHAEGPCAMIWLPKLFGKRCIATIHGLDHKRAKWGKLAKEYIMLGEYFAANFADEIIVLSKEVEGYFLNKYRRKTRFIPNGVKRPIIRETELVKKKFGLEKDEYILFLGRLVPEKGLKYLIEAYKLVKTNKKLVIAGGSSDTEEFAIELKEMAKGDERIIFTGFVQGQVLDELYSNTYVYVLPSDLEGMPLSLLEAMSYGNCCLVSDIEECASVVGEYGVTFEKANVDDLRGKLQMLCDNIEVVEGYKCKATDYICDKYNWDEVVEKTMELYGGRND